jgi:hypothetical protein
MFLKPHYVVIYDYAVSHQTPRTFDWLLHLSNKQELEMQSTSALYSTAKATMGIQILEPVHASFETRTGHLPFALVSTAASAALPPVPTILDVRPAAPALEQKFLVVLSLARKKEGAADLMSQVKKISGRACTGVELMSKGFSSRHHQYPAMVIGQQTRVPGVSLRPSSRAKRLPSCEMVKEQSGGVT